MATRLSGAEQVLKREGIHHMKARRGIPAVAALAGAALAAVGCSSSSSSSSSGHQRRRRFRRQRRGRLLQPAPAGRVQRADHPAGQRDQARARGGKNKGRPVHRELQELDDSTAAAGSGTRARPRPTQAGRDRPKAVYYIGEFTPALRGVDPILNQAGSPRSAGETYVGLNHQPAGQRGW